MCMYSLWNVSIPRACVNWPLKVAVCQLIGLHTGSRIVHLCIYLFISWQITQSILPAAMITILIDNFVLSANVTEV